MQHKQECFANLKNLPSTPTFGDVTFTCKDGEIKGNRLILSVSSTFFANIIKNNSVITSSSLHNNSPLFDIHLPEVHVRDVENLFKTVVKGSDFVEINSNHMTGVENLAKVFEIELVVRKFNSGLTKVKAIPKNESQDDCFYVNDDGHQTVNCEQSLDIDDEIQNLSDLNEILILEAELSSKPDEETDEDTVFNSYENIASTNYRQEEGGGGPALNFLSRNPSCSSNVVKGTIRNEIMETSAEEEAQTSLDDHNNNNIDADIIYVGGPFKRTQVYGPASKRFLRNTNKMKMLDKMDLHLIHSCEKVEEMNKAPEDMITEKPECSTTEKICPFCTITCASGHGLKTHIGIAHQYKDERSAAHQDMMDICKCGKMFSKNSKTIYKEHRQKCEIYRKDAFICEECHAPFDSMHALNVHKYFVHGVIMKARTCVCGQSFETRYNFRKHEINCIVYRQKAMFCEECNLPFLRKAHLKLHLRSTGHFHKDIQRLDLQPSHKVVICKCGKAFSKYSKISFKEHQNVCRKFKKEAFICEICKSGFVEMPSLKLHQRRAHKIFKQKEMSCVCGMTFNTRSSCRKHSISCRMYRNTAISCEVCQLPFPTRRHYELHVCSASAH